MNKINLVSIVFMKVRPNSEIILSFYACFAVVDNEPTKGDSSIESSESNIALRNNKKLASLL